MSRFAQFEIMETCPGYPVDDRLRFRQERCCIILLVEHLLKKIPVKTVGVKKVVLELRLAEARGTYDGLAFGSILSISHPFDFAHYFRAVAGERSAKLADASEAALTSLAEGRGWSISAIQEIFSKVRNAGYRLDADRAKACRSPDGTKRARVSYHVDRDEFRIEVTVIGPKKVVLLRKTLFRDKPTAGLCVYFTLGKPFWASNRKLVIPMMKPNISNGQLVVKIP